jgi:hypothetical protein
LRPDLYELDFVLSVLTLTTFADVYSYNFPDDRLLVKSVGKYRIPLSCYVNDEAIFLAYFVFMLETAQTVLSGLDIYFWFVDGFGNVERLSDSHYAPIDIPIIHSVISFVVQTCLIYRIWTLNRRLTAFCMVIFTVRVRCPLYPNLLTQDFCIKFTILQSIGTMWGGIAASTM